MLVVRGPAARAVPVTAIGESICAATGDRFAPEQVIDLCRNAHRTSRSEPRSHRLGTATSRQPRSRTGQAGDCELTLLAVHTPTPPTSRAWPATIPEALQDNWDDGFTLTDATDALAEHPDNQILEPQSRRRPSAGLLGAPDRRRPHRPAGGAVCVVVGELTAVEAGSPAPSRSASTSRGALRGRTVTPKPWRVTAKSHARNETAAGAAGYPGRNRADRSSTY